MTTPDGESESVDTGVAKNGGAGLAGLMVDYPGAKNGAGVAQRIISQMPPHEIYIEAFVGSGAVLKSKRPATSTVVIDADAAVCDYWRTVAGVVVIHGDARSWLRAWTFEGNELVYCDPPYLLSSRSCQRPLYRHELATEDDHRELLDVLKSLPCPVLLSGYPSSLYSAALDGWRCLSYTTGTHGGPVTECLWLNFPEPFALHDYRFLGENRRQRERIKRRKLRWMARLRSMSHLERGAMLDAIAAVAAENGGAISSPKLAAMDP